jgi:putative aldouronate transport system substrate-binding protein
MKKLLTLTLAVLLLFLMACSGTTSNKPTPTDSATQTPTKTEEPAPVENDEVVKLTVEVFDRNNIDPTVGTVTDNEWTRFIQESMLKEGVEIEFVPVPRGEETQKITVLMAAGTAPDIIFTYDRSLFQKFATEGGLHELSDLVDQYGPDLVEYAGEISLPYGYIGDKLFGIPALRVNVGHIVPFIRTDWLDKVGMPKPTNRDELVEVLRAFKEADLGNGTTIPWSGGLDGSAYGKMQDVINSFSTNEEYEHYTVPKWIRESYKECAKWMNGLYAEGLIDPEFATRESKNDPVKQSMAGFFMEGWWVPHTLSGDNAILLAAQEIDPEAMIEVVNCFPDKNGKYYKMTYTPTGLFNMVPKTCKNPEAAVKYLNWMCRQENAYMINYGVEGEMYTIEDGVPISIVNDETIKRRAPLGDLALMFNGGWNFELEKNMTIQEKNNPLFGKQVAEALKISQMDGVYEPFYQVTIEAEREYLSEIQSAAAEWWVKLVVEPDFETNWENYLKEMEARGIKELQAEYEEYYETYMR